MTNQKLKGLFNKKLTKDILVLKDCELLSLKGGSSGSGSKL